MDGLVEWMGGWTSHGYTLHAKGKAQRGGERKGTDRWKTQFKDIGILPSQNSELVLFQAEVHVILYLCVCACAFVFVKLEVSWIGGFLWVFLFLGSRSICSFEIAKWHDYKACRLCLLAMSS